MQIIIDSATFSRAIEGSLYIAVEKLVVCVDASLPLKRDALKGRALKRLGQICICSAKHVGLRAAH